MQIEAQQALATEGIQVSVVSMPSWDLFEKQDDAYKKSVLPSHLTKRLAIEMGSSLGWHRYVGFEGDVIAIDKFGASAPGEIVMKEYGFSVENVVSKMKKLLQK